MNFTDVDADRMLSIKAQIANDISGMTKVRDVLKSQVMSTLDVNWKGQAKDSFAAQFNVLSTAFDNYVKSCETLNNEMEKAAREYNRADEDTRRFVNNLPK